MLRTYLYIAALLLLTTAIYLWDKNQPVTEKKPVVQEYEEFSEQYVSPLGEIIENLSNPVEFGAILRDSNIAYDTSLLFDSPLQVSQTHEQTKAMLLGVTAADFMYKNFHNQDITKEKNAINQLAQELKIDQYWNFENVPFIADNLDTITFLAVNGIDSMCVNENNEPTAFLMFWGYWVEFTYIALKKSNVKEIRDVAGEQKISIIEIFATNKYYQIPIIEKYAGKLKRVYEPVEVTVEYGDLEVKGCQRLLSKIIVPQPVIDSALVIITDIRNDLCRLLGIKSLYNKNDTLCYGYRNMGY